jgi:hypothetical protein
VLNVKVYLYMLLSYLSSVKQYMLYVRYKQQMLCVNYKQQMLSIK